MKRYKVVEGKCPVEAMRGNDSDELFLQDMLPEPGQVPTLFALEGAKRFAAVGSEYDESEVKTRSEQFTESVKYLDKGHKVELNIGRWMDRQALVYGTVLSVPEAEDFPTLDWWDIPLEVQVTSVRYFDDIQEEISMSQIVNVKRRNVQSMPLTLGYCKIMGPCGHYH